jgi:hypothetical protein
MLSEFIISIRRRIAAQNASPRAANRAFQAAAILQGF